MADRAWQEAWVVVNEVRALRETVYGVKTRYVHAGEGEPVILVHGGGPGAGGDSGWPNTIPALAKNFHVYALDLIGFGYTDKPLIDYSFQTFVNHLAGFIDALNLRDVRICGNSQGAYVAIKYVLDHPERVKRAALISTGTLAGAVGIREGGRGVVPLPRFDGTKESLRKFLEVIVNDRARLTDELIDSRFAAASLPGHREMMDSIGEYRKLMASDSSSRQVYDVRARLPMLKIPWCMIWGGDDRSAPLDPLGVGLHELVPEVPFHVVEGSGHQVQNDKPAECNKLLLDFFTADARQPVPA
jgi:pimeloyl-ACP methyl ester carboxylesterase